MKDYYKILGVPKDASLDDIKKAYRSKAMKHHPDRGGDPKQFQEIQEAYNTIGDEGKKSEYDNPQPQMHGFHQAGPFTNSAGGPGFDDLFRFFGDGFGSPFFRNASVPKNRNITLQANITLEDAFTGKELYVNVQLPSGREQLINVKVPAGVHDGVNLRLAGMGDDSFQMSPRGDVIVQVHVQPHHKFQRQGDDLIQEISISCIDAMLGKEVVIDTIDGKQFTGAIPAGTQPDAMLGIHGQGMPFMNNPNQRGRMLLRVKMFVPTLTDAQRELIKTI
jgi:DnaJ-class molecular chaperone